MPGDTGRFQLNDVELNIPPQQIQVDKKSVNHMWNTLRTKSSIKSKSGFSNIRIMVSAKFTTSLNSAPPGSTLNGLEQLRNLVSQFRVTPFCYVENQFIRDSVLGGSPEPTMALALEQIQITKENESTNCVEVTMFFQWFNYFPFLKEWAYKRDFFSALSESDPRDSLPWRVMYQAEQMRGKYAQIKELNDKATSLSFTQFATLTVEQYRELEKDFNAFKELEDKVFATLEGGTDSSENANNLINNSLVKSRGRERGKLLKEELFGHFTTIGPENLTLQVAADVITKTIANATESRFGFLDKDVWEIVVNNRGELVTYGDIPQAPRRELGGNLKPENILLMQRKRRISFDSPQGGLILTGITISFENVLAQLPLIGHPFPTFQHIGSVDAVVTMSIVTTSGEALAALSNFYNTIEDQAFKFKNIPQGQRNLVLENPLINMCGLHEFLPNALITGTIPGQPGTYTASLELIDNPISANTREAIQPGQRFQTRTDIRNAISDIMMRNIAFNRDFGHTKEILRSKFNTTGLYSYAPSGKTSGDEKRNFAFRSLCNEYIKEFNALYLEMFNFFADGDYNFFRGNVPVSPVDFFSLVDDDVPSIQRLQQDMFPAIQHLLADIFNASLRFAPSSVESARIQATRNIKTSRDAGLKSIQTAETIRRGTAEVDASTREFLKTSFIGDIKEQQVDRVPNFINKYMQEWLAFSIPFLDKITFGDLIHLEQFEPVRDLLVENTMQSSGDCYPDFPLRQVVEVLATSDKAALQAASKEIINKAKRGNFGARNMGFSTLIQPDFFMYNTQNDDVNDLIPYNVQLAAVNSIIGAEGSLSQRDEAENSWLENAYEAKLGGNLAGQIRRDASDQQFDKKFWKSGEEEQIAVREAVRAQIQASGGAFHYQDLTGDGLGCSIQTEANAENGESIQLPKMDLSVFSIAGESRTPGLMVLKNRPSAALETNDLHYSKAQHRFGADSIAFRGQSSYLPDRARDPNKEPKWAWPTDPNVRLISLKGHASLSRTIGNTTRPHKGIDISGRGVKNTWKQRVLAAAAGDLTWISPVSWLKTDRSGGSGNWIEIKHTDGWKTKYLHLDWSEETVKMSNLFHGRTDGTNIAKPIKVVLHQPIGRIGNTGKGVDRGTGPGNNAHLHFEIRKGKKFDINLHDPEKKLKGGGQKSQGPITGINPDNESLLTKSIEQLEKDIRNGQGYSLIRAYPTFRLYFIESDLGERKRFGFDDFFSYSSIKDIKVIRSRKVGVDLAIITMTNVSGVLSNRKFKELADPEDSRDKNEKITAENPLDPRLTNTVNENPIASLMLKAGQQMQLRLGYNNNPDELETVLNGVITDVQFSESDDLITIVCQSFAVELVQNQHGDVKSFGGFLSGSGRTGKILEELMTLPEVTHFGRWEGGKATNSVYGVLRNEWNFVPSPQDDNIFAPRGRGIWGLFDSTVKYSLYQSTIWDTFQEMTLRHPSYCTYPIPYEGKWGPRMTMFFGLPDQLYFARDPSIAEDNKVEGIRQVVNDAAEVLENNRSELEEHIDPNLSGINRILAKLKFSLARDAGAIAGAGSPTGALSTGSDLQQHDSPAEVARRDLIKQRLKQFSLDQGFIKPFRSYHVLTSTQHILMNSVESSSNVFNTITLQYGDNDASVNEQAQRLDFGTLETFSLKADAAIKDEDIKELFAQYPNCIGYEMAKRYAVGLLHYSMKENYRGSIVIVGNPRIKPHDICYVFDEYTDMFGPIEVEQVVHKFSQESGFITEITPDLVVHVNQLSTMSTSDAMGLMAEHALKNMKLQSSPSLQTSTSNASLSGVTAVDTILDTAAAVAGAGKVVLDTTFAPIANMFFNSSENTLSQGTSTNPYGLIGAFIFKKLITRSQLAHPFRYSPLVKGGHAMVGGLPIAKTEGSFTQTLADDIKKWAQDADKGIGLMLSDVYDKYQPNNWVGRSQGDFYDTILGR